MLRSYWADDTGHRNGFPLIRSTESRITRSIVFKGLYLYKSESPYVGKRPSLTEGGVSPEGPLPTPVLH